MTACQHNIAHGRLQQKTHMEYFYKESLRKIREVVNILHLYRYRMRRMFAQAIHYSFMVQQGDTWIQVAKES